MNEISNEERTLIERHILLPYALYYLEQDFSGAKEKPGFAIEKHVIPILKKAAQQEQFRVNNELRKRKIRVKSAKGWYQAEVNGVVIEKKMDADMVRAKSEELLMELIKPPK